MQFWSVSSELIGCFESLQGGGGKLLDAPLGKEGALDGLELWSWLGVLQGRVGGCHRTLDQFGVMVWELAVGQFVSLDNPGVSEDLLCSQSLMGVHMKHFGHKILGGVGHSVPVASCQTEVTVAYPVQDLIRGVLRSVGKWSKTGQHGVQ